MAAFTQAFLRYGAQNCMKDCYDDTFRADSPFFCRHGREMGWCCPDDSRYECQENKDLDMICSYDQDFFQELKYFSCVRDSTNCGSANTVFYAVPGYGQYIILQKKESTGSTSTYGDICWYDVR